MGKMEVFIIPVDSISLLLPCRCVASEGLIVVLLCGLCISVAFGDFDSIRCRR